MFAIGSFFTVRIALPVPCPYRACANYAFSRVVIIMKYHVEIMKKVAQEQGMVCHLHEKPFEGITEAVSTTINWSMSTDTVLNLLNPGTSPESNTLFKLVLAAVIKAGDATGCP